jgi:hypothetical protein
MNKIKNQLESAIERELNKLVLDNFDFEIEMNLEKLAKIKAVGLFQHVNFEDKIKNGESHIIPIYGIVSAIIKTNFGSKIIDLSFKQPSVEVKFDWANDEFIIKDIQSFRYSKPN